MFELLVKLDFDAAHRLVEYKGKCENLHGHNWKVDITVAAENVDKEGMVKDFKTIKEMSNVVINQLDHKYLNEIEFFKKVNPTSENIAKYIFDNLIDAFKKESIMLKKVSVWETDTACASYYR